jgi:hypothetical protein
MTRKWTIALTALVAALLAIAATGCGDDEGDSGGATATQAAAEDAVDQLCTDLDALQAAALDLQAIDATNTVDELQAARDDVGQAVADVESSAADVTEARVDDLSTAYENLDETVNGVEGEQTLTEVQADLQAAVVDVITARAELSASLNCPGAATATP